MKSLIILLLLFNLVSCNKTINTNGEAEEIFCNVKINESNKELIKYLKEDKYFICHNLNDYISYYLLYNSDIKTTIKRVNVGLLNKYYVNIKESDLSKDYLILINKYNYLNESYIPLDLEEISLEYNRAKNNKLRRIARINFEKMCEDAKKEGVILYNSSAYRDFKYQEQLYYKYAISSSIDYADTYSARAGHSEHQSGLTLDINIINLSFQYTKEYDWLKNNSYKYGFILRYPLGKEDLTGYTFEPWHYRYVGVSAAKNIYEEDITFDEYYAYYLNDYDD